MRAAKQDDQIRRSRIAHLQRVYRSPVVRSAQLGPFHKRRFRQSLHETIIALDQEQLLSSHDPRARRHFETGRLPPVGNCSIKQHRLAVRLQLRHVAMVCRQVTQCDRHRRPGLGIVAKRIPRARIDRRRVFGRHQDCKTALSLDRAARL